jgi:hypothetical protein
MFLKRTCHSEMSVRDQFHVGQHGQHSGYHENAGDQP